MTRDVLPPVLYHYTCAHGARGVLADRELKPNPHPWLGVPLIWLTDLDVGHRAALGLTANYLKCDRSEYRVEVRSAPDVVRWTLWAELAEIPPLIRDAIEGGGAMPLHWWVAARPLSILDVRLNERGRGLVGGGLS